MCDTSAAKVAAGSCTSASATSVKGPNCQSWCITESLETFFESRKTEELANPSPWSFNEFNEKLPAAIHTGFVELYHSCDMLWH